MPRLRAKLKQPAQAKVRKPAKAEGNAAERAYQMIREEIILRLPPGSELDDSDVLRKLGLSRTPVREALARLAGERLVQLLPNKGARVAPAGWTEIREHIESLDVMQRLVTRWAAVRRTTDEVVKIKHEQKSFEAAAVRRDGVGLTEANWRFHTAIGASCRNSVFDRCYKQILTEGLRIDRHAMFMDSFDSAASRDAHVDLIIADHTAMVDAIAAGDPDAAEQAAQRHADLARKRISEALIGPAGGALTIRLDTEEERKS
jgi:DNA-binding GntR family transcriptional regulator